MINTMMHYTPLIGMVSLLALVGMAVAQQPPVLNLQDTPTLIVNGDAEVAADPDRAVVRLGAVAQAADAAGAQDQVNQIMQKAIAAIREAGIDEKLIQTEGLSLQPVYSQSTRRQMEEGEAHTPTIVAYRASNTVRVQVEDLPKVGAVIDAGIAAGANQLQGIHFELKDDTNARALALEQATQRARQKAEVLARASGVELKSLHNITENSVSIIAPVYGGGLRTMQMEATPVQPGQIRVQATVTLVFRIGE